MRRLLQNAIHKDKLHYRTLTDKPKDNGEDKINKDNTNQASANVEDLALGKRVFLSYKNVIWGRYPRPQRMRKSSESATIDADLISYPSLTPINFSLVTFLRQFWASNGRQISDARFRRIESDQWSTRRERRWTGDAQWSVIGHNQAVATVAT